MRHAVIENGIIVNIVLSEPDFAAEMGWIACPEYVGDQALDIGWSYDGTNWINPNPPVAPQQTPE
jgi:hypothetical protein